MINLSVNFLYTFESHSFSRSTNRTSHVDSSKTEEKLEIRDIILNFQTVAESIPGVMLLLVSMSLESLFTSNSISKILLTSASAKGEFAKGETGASKSLEFASEWRFLLDIEYS